MEKLTYDQVVSNFTKSANKRGTGTFITPDFGTLIMAVVDSINENISWEGLTVACKNKVILPHELNVFERDEFEANTSFECISDMDDMVKILHRDGAFYESPKEWFYIVKDK